MISCRSLLCVIVCVCLLFGACLGESNIVEGQVVPQEEPVEPVEEAAPVIEAEVTSDEEYVVYDPEEEQQLEALEANTSDLSAINGMMNILLLGIDARPGEKTGRSDTMILMTLDADHNCIKLTSFMRDLYVEIPGRKNNRLNAAYIFGGIDLLKRTMKENFGFDVDHYAAVNFSVLGSVIDQMGGLVIDVPEKYLPRINAVIYQDNLVLGIAEDDGYIQQPGEQLLTGKQAQAYARYRYGTPDGDFGRTVRQREVILKCMEKLKSMSMTQLIQLAINNIDSVSTDMNIIDLMSIAPAAFELKDSEVKQLRIPIDGSFSIETISKMWVMVPNRTKNLNAIKNFLLEE